MTNKSSKPANQPPADDRNIVPVDSSYEGANLEDQLFLFWHKFKTIIVACAVLGVLILAGWGILSVFQESQEARIQEEYQQAVISGEFIPFAEKTGSHPLAGLAYLQAADEKFEAEEYAEAATLYENAAGSLEDQAFNGRARIGKGVALALDGKQEEALAHLEEVARDGGNLGITRAEAHYHAASIATELNRPDVARTHIEEAMKLDRSQIWAGRAMALQQSLPKQEVAEEESGEQSAEAVEAAK